MTDWMMYSNFIIIHLGYTCVEYKVVGRSVLVKIAILAEIKGKYFVEFFFLLICWTISVVP